MSGRNHTRRFPSERRGIADAKLRFVMLTPLRFTAWQEEQLSRAADAERRGDAKARRRFLAAATYTPRGR